jgi:hypothetical protein
MDEQEKAIRAWTARYQESRQGMIAAIMTALRAGERPTDVSAWSPFTAAYVRKLAREHGVAPRIKGKVPGNTGTGEAGNRG